MLARLLLDIVQRCSRHSALQKENVVTFLTITFNRNNGVVYSKLYFMSWNCANVCDLLQFLRIIEIKLSRKMYVSPESPKTFFTISEKNSREKYILFVIIKISFIL